MKTIIKKVNNSNYYKYNYVFDKAGEILKNDGLVAFPTETVYGLGANAMSASAVSKIYQAKGRPSDNPLIVHISKVSDIENIACNISDSAYEVINIFWPGPLTVILNKKDTVPYETSGGLDTIAVRMPSNNIAQHLISTSGVYIAAPSANISGRPSPTRASHVLFDLNGKIDMIIDGGACEYGLESTIIDLSTEIPCILRPGSITVKMLQDVLGYVEVDKGLNTDIIVSKAPGMKYTHYSPEAKLVIVNGNEENIINKIKELSKVNKTNKLGILATDESKHRYEGLGVVLSAGERKRPSTVATNLFRVLREFDFNGVDIIYAEGFMENGIGLAIMNRLKKAAGYDIIDADS